MPQVEAAEDLAEVAKAKASPSPVLIRAAISRPAEGPEEIEDHPRNPPTNSIPTLSISLPGGLFRPATHVKGYQEREEVTTPNSHHYKPTTPNTTSLHPLIHSLLLRGPLV